MSAALPHIAVLDDEPDVTDLICSYIAGHGFRASACHRGAELFELMSTDPPGVVLLDIGLPGEDGFAIARRLRERWRCGLIIVSGRGESIDKVVGLEIGADDYVTKPFDLRELVARVKAVQRRIEGSLAAPASAFTTGERLRFEGFVLELAGRRLLGTDGHEVKLTSGEFDLLRVLAQHAGRVLTRDFLLEHTRGREAGPFDRTIDVQIGRIRRKIEVDAENPQIIKSVRSAGYLFVPKVQAA
jgi:two-component system OmpR family response regulator